MLHKEDAFFKCPTLQDSQADRRSHKIHLVGLLQHRVWAGIVILSSRFQLEQNLQSTFLPIIFNGTIHLTDGIFTLPSGAKLPRAVSLHDGVSPEVYEPPPFLENLGWTLCRRAQTFHGISMGCLIARCPTNLAILFQKCDLWEITLNSAEKPVLHIFQDVRRMPLWCTWYQA